MKKAIIYLSAICVIGFSVLFYLAQKRKTNSVSVPDQVVTQSSTTAAELSDTPQTTNQQDLNPDRITHWRKLAEQGNAQAQSNLCVIYALGHTTAKDYQQALTWCRKSADQGVAMAQNNLGVMFSQGLGIAQDDAQAFDWFRKAAEQGHASAQANLAAMYHTGRGVAQNYQQAMTWYTKAALQQVAKAQFGLGNMYAQGQGTPKDYQQAVVWFNKAAEQGHNKAQHNLGVMYANGQGTAKDIVQAHKWFSLAALGEPRAAESKKRAESEMTQSQIEQATARARDWKPNTMLPPSPIEPVARDAQNNIERSGATPTGGSSNNIAMCAVYARAMVDSPSRSEWLANANRIKSECPGKGFECTTYKNTPGKNRCESFDWDGGRTFFKDVKHDFPINHPVSRGGF